MYDVKLSVAEHQSAWEQSGGTLKPRVPKATHTERKLIPHKVLFQVPNLCPFDSSLHQIE